MNKEPLMYNVKNADHELFFLVSCCESGNQDSLNAAIIQMQTSLDKASLERNEPITHRAAINEIEPADFPDVEKVYAHNEYTPTENTKVLIRCYIGFEDQETKQGRVEPFHGRITFKDGKYFLSLLENQGQPQQEEIAQEQREQEVTQVAIPDIVFQPS